MTVANLTAGGPATSAGGALRAPLGTVAPTDASIAFDEAWAKLGLVGNEGLTPGGERSIEDVLDWNGDVVANLQSQHSSVFTFPLLSVFAEEVQRLVFGDANVTVTPATATTGKLITVTETGSELPHAAFAWDMRHVAKKIRLIAPNAKPTTIEESAFTVGGLNMFTVTVSCYKDDNGIKVYRHYDDGTPSAAA